MDRAIRSVSNENGRQWDYYRTLSGSMDELINRQESLESNVRITDERFTTTLDKIELSRYAKIYDLEITICKMEHYQDHISDIKKRTVIMKNVVGINPLVERTATTVDTGLWYGSSVEIPTIMDDEDEYACDLKVLSVR